MLMMMMTIVLGKMAHEMRGVLLVILLFMLSDKHKKSLLERVGDEMLSQFVQLFELTIMFECWLDCDEFTREELEVAKQFNPILIQMLINNVKQKNGMKLPKIINCNILLNKFMILVLQATYLEELEK